MKKIATIAACAMLALSLSGCWQRSSAARNRSSSETTTVAYAPQPESNSGNSVTHTKSESGAPLLSDVSFDSEITNSQGVAIVDFFARWCGPCKRMLPIIDSMATEVSEAKIAKVDVDAAEQTASRFDVHAMPCFVIFKDGKEVDRHYGIHSKDEIRGWIQTYADKAVSLAR